MKRLFLCIFQICLLGLLSFSIIAQTKFEKTFKESTFSSESQAGKVDISSLRNFSKSVDNNTVSKRDLSHIGWPLVARTASISKSLIIKKIEEDDRLVWLEVSPSRDIVKSSNLIKKTYQLLQEYAGDLQFKDVESELSVTSISEDELGESHIRMQQLYQGIPVHGGEIIVHTKIGQPYLINANTKFINKLNSTTPTILAAEAEQTAMKLANAIEISSHLLQYVGGNQSSASLKIYVDQDQKPNLAYHVTLYPDISERWEYIIDAKNGNLLHSYHSSCKFHNHDLVHDIDHDHIQKQEPVDLKSGPESTSGQDLSGQNITVNAYEEGGFYYLLNVGEKMFNPSKSNLPNEPIGGILTLNAKKTSPQTNDFSVDHIVSNSGSWNAPIGVTAHNNATTVYRYYETVFGRNSFDNRGSTILSFINVADENGLGMDNAFWNGNGMYYGNGNKSFSTSLAASLDVAAHELSHGVVQYTANLNYEFESGALNESFADIFAVLIERKNYAIGEDVVNTSVFPSGALRSMSDPHNGGTRLGDPGWQPSSVSEQYRGREDNGGVHINSGIPNHAFYLFSSNSRVGVNNAEIIYFKALRDYLTASSDFKSLRRAIEQSIVDLGNDPSIMAAFNEAFDAVGIEGSNPNEPTPDPVEEYVINPGDDFVLWYKPSTQEINIRYNSSGVDEVLSTKGLINTPSISDDGRLILFIGADQKMYALLIDWEANSLEERLIDERQWRNVAISKDGNKLAALMGNLSANEFDNKMLVIDFISNTEKFFTLTNPTTAQGVSTSDVRFADAIQWDHTSQFVMYDANNEVSTLFSDPINYWDIGFIQVWNNSEDSFDDGTVFKLFPSLPDGISVGNPTFSNLSPDRIALDVLDGSEGDVKFTILGVNLETGDQGVIYDQGNVAGFPNYSRTDEELLFNFNNSGTTPVVATIPLASDAITGGGNASILVDNATWGTWFSNGQRDLSTPTEEFGLETSVTLFPNPADQFLQLQSDIVRCQPCQMEIHNSQGRLVIRGAYTDTEKIDIRHLSPALYSLKIRNGDKSYVKQFVKQ